MIVGRSLKRFFKVQVQRIRMSPINKKSESCNFNVSQSVRITYRRDETWFVQINHATLAEIRTVFIIFISITWKAPLRHTSRDVWRNGSEHYYLLFGMMCVWSQEITVLGRNVCQRGTQSTKEKSVGPLCLTRTCRVAWVIIICFLPSEPGTREATPSGDRT